MPPILKLLVDINIFSILCIDVVTVSGHVDVTSVTCWCDNRQQGWHVSMQDLLSDLIDKIFLYSSYLHHHWDRIIHSYPCSGQVFSLPWFAPTIAYFRLGSWGSSPPQELDACVVTSYHLFICESANVIQYLCLNNAPGMIHIVFLSAFFKIYCRQINQLYIYK